MQQPPPLDPLVRARLERNIRRYYATGFLLHFQLWIPIWVLYLTIERGIPLAQVALLEGIMSVFAIILEVPTGVVADRWGRKTSLVLGAWTSAVAILLFGFATDVTSILICYLVWAAAIALMSGADSALILGSLKALDREGEFGHVMGRSQAFIIGGSLAGTLIGAPVAAATDLVTPIFLSVGLGVIGAIAAMTLHEPPRETADYSSSYVRTLGTAGQTVMRTPVLAWAIAAFAAVHGLGNASLIITQPLLEHEGISITGIGVVSAFGQIASISGALLSARIATRFGDAAALGIICIVIAATHAGIALTGGLAVALLVPLMRGSFGFSNPIIRSAIARASPENIRATASSIGAMFNALMLVLLQPVLGALAERQGYGTAYMTAAILVATAGPIAVIGWYRAALRARSEERAMRSEKRGPRSED